MILNHEDLTILNAIESFRAGNGYNPGVSDIMKRLKTTTTIYNQVELLKKRGYILTTKKGQKPELVLTIKGYSVLEKEVPANIMVITPETVETKKKEMSKKEKMMNITSWLYINDGAYNSKKEWRKALLEMLDKTI